MAGLDLQISAEKGTDGNGRLKIMETPRRYKHQAGREPHRDVREGEAEWRKMAMAWPKIFCLN